MANSTGRGRPIDALLVKDNPGDVRLAQEAFKQARVENDLSVVTRGIQAPDYLHGRGVGGRRRRYGDESRRDDERASTGWYQTRAV